MNGEIWKLKITLLTDFNTAGGRKGSTIGVLKDDKFVYIPATHIKGVVRSEIERFGKVEIANALFGRETAEEGEYGEPKIKFLDAISPSKNITDMERSHVTIAIEFQSAAEKELFTQKVVPAGTEFIGFIIVRGELTEEEKKVLRGGLVSAGHYGLGNSRSRGLGSVKIEMEKSTMEEIRKVYLQGDF
ncbi:MAG: RAMP superfamily CRISPR-associated protein [Thermoplasmata archaeon]